MMRRNRAYAGLDRFRLLAAFLVIAIHISPLETINGTGDFILTRIIGRTAVPFFFMTSGFFLEKDVLDPAGKRKEFVKKLLMLYGISILLYLPLNVYMGYFRETLLLPVLLKDLLFNGTLYHLWYFPAAVIGAILSGVLIRRFGYRKAFLAAAGLYAAGLLGDSYFGIAQRVPVLRLFYENLFAVSDYTRNGIFYAPVFFVMGGWIAAEGPKAGQKQTASCLAGFLAGMALMTAEGLLLRNSGIMRHDSMYLFLLPVMYFLFGLLLKIRGPRQSWARDASMIMYIVHPALIVAVRASVKLFSLPSALVTQPLLLYAAVAVLSLGTGLFCHVLKTRIRRRQRGRSRKQCLRRRAQTGLRAWKELDRENLRHNVRVLERAMPPGCSLMAVVKAEAYGCGGAQAARCMMQAGVRTFAVAALDEGIQLRKQEVRGEILVLGYTHPNRAGELRRYDLTQTVCDYEHARALNAGGRTLKVHLAVDTGMHRLGIGLQEADRAEEILGMKHLRVTGIFTHLSAADSEVPEDRAFTEEQIRRFSLFLDELFRRGISLPAVHIQSSYGFLNYPAEGCSYVRAGILLCGADSSDRIYKARKLDLRPVLSLRAKVASVRTIGPGESVGYNRTYQAESRRRIAVVTIGYGDGYPRSLSGAGTVLIRGRRVPVIGRICMDQLMVDVSAVPETEPGDTATLIGRDGREEIRAEEVAGEAETIVNELFSRLGRRLRQVWV